MAPSEVCCEIVIIGWCGLKTLQCCLYQEKRKKRFLKEKHAGLINFHSKFSADQNSVLHVMAVMLCKFVIGNHMCMHFDLGSEI